MAETGRYKRVFEKDIERKAFGRLACMVHVGYIKNPLKLDIREQFYLAQDLGITFEWVNPEHQHELGDISELIKIAVILVSNDMEERPLQERFQTTMEVLEKAG